MTNLPDRPGSIPVVELTAADTHDLRRRILRSHLPEPDVHYPADLLPGSFHLGVREGDKVVATASFSLEPAPGRPNIKAARLRGMAVDTSHERRGLGRAILQAAIRRLRSEGIELCWANARTSALPFYRSQGFREEGDEFHSIGLPHRVVVLGLRS